MSSLWPSRADLTPLRTSWRTDLTAGLTVGVVALPLALAFGASAGVGPTAGIVTAIVAGAIAAVFGGSNVQVSGPTGAMVVVLAPIVAEHGTASVAAVALLAGVIVVIAAVARLGRVINLVPWPVIEGFTLGIAVIIACQQVPALLGQEADLGRSAPSGAWHALVSATWAQAGASVLVAGIVVATMVACRRWLRRLPASLVAITVATVVVELADLTVPRIGALPDRLPAPSLPDVDPSTLTALLGPAVAVAALAAIESLLSARVAATMADVGDLEPDRELMGQGLASIGAGLFGGMPATGAIARTAVNLNAGGRSRLAALTHSAVLLLIVATLSQTVAHIPLAALGAVLVMVSASMIDARSPRALLRADRAGLAVYAVTAVVTISFDLIVAIQIGIVAAAFFVLRTMADSSSVVREPVPGRAQPGDERIAVLRIDGSVFFGAADRVVDQLKAVDDVDVVIVRMSQLILLDTTGARRLAEVIGDLERRGVTVLVKGIQDQHRHLTAGVGVLDALRHSKHLFDDLDEAVAHARSHVRRATQQQRDGTARPD